MNKSQVRNGIKKALFGSLETAGYAKDLLERGGSTTLSLGLYSISIEEYGKSKLLQEFLNQDDKSLSIPKNIFESYNLKFEKAFSSLPENCTTYSGNFKISIPDLRRQKPLTKNKIKLKDTVEIAQTGEFSNNNLPLNFEVRKTCFYLDWDEIENKWAKPPKINHDGLLSAIKEFEKFVSKELDTEYDSQR